MTGKTWVDRYGLAVGNGLRKSGNVESYLTYQKLHRTGKLLRSVRVRAVGKQVVWSSSASYAREHDLGGMATGGQRKATGSKVQGGAKTVYLGGRSVQARPFAAPGPKILRMPERLIGAKMRSFGW